MAESMLSAEPRGKKCASNGRQRGGVDLSDEAPLLLAADSLRRKGIGGDAGVEKRKDSRLKSERAAAGSQA